MEPLVTIGLDAALVERLRKVLNARLIAFPALPRAYSLDGVLHVESATVQGRWLRPRGVVFYGYFDDAAYLRRAIALSDVPSFPDVRATLPLDERAMALAVALRADEPTATRRGFLVPGTTATADGVHVLKTGDRHCGEGKELASGAIDVGSAAVVEPFIAGDSVRILIVGEHTWQLAYESDDWRKNVRARVSVTPTSSSLAHRARHTIGRLDLRIAGVDYVVGGGEPVLLEVNAYPGLDDVPQAETAFVEEVRTWWESITSAPSF